MNNNFKTRRSIRSGFVLIVVLVCLSVIGALIFSALQTSLRQRKQLDRELQMEQTRLLAEAGLVHAIDLVDAKEDLVVIEPALHESKHAEVKIELTRNSDAVDVTVTAWIGLKDRPETQTRQILNTNVEISSEE